MTIVCEPDRAAAAALSTMLKFAGPVETLPNLAIAASLLEADTDEDLVVIGANAPLDEAIQFTHDVHVRRPTVSVLLLRHTVDPKATEEALAVGVSAVLPADEPAILAAAVQNHQSARVTLPLPAAATSFDTMLLEN